MSPLRIVPAVESGKPRVCRALRCSMETAGIEPARCFRRLIAAVCRAFAPGSRTLVASRQRSTGYGLRHPIPPASSAIISVFSETPWRSASAASAACRSRGSRTRNCPEWSGMAPVQVAACAAHLALAAGPKRLACGGGVGVRVADGPAVLLGVGADFGAVLGFLRGDDDVAGSGVGHAVMVPRAEPLSRGLAA